MCKLMLQIHIMGPPSLTNYNNEKYDPELEPSSNPLSSIFSSAVPPTSFPGVAVVEDPKHSQPRSHLGLFPPGREASNHGLN